jgi:hypothetical protein
MAVRPQKDRDERLPRDVVLAFFEDVARGDVRAAKHWWLDDADPNRLTPRPADSFEIYVQGLARFDRLVVGRLGKGKSGYTLVYYQGFSGGTLVRPNGYYPLKMVDGRWQIVRGLEW